VFSSRTISKGTNNNNLKFKITSRINSALEETESISGLDHSSG